MAAALLRPASFPSLAFVQNSSLAAIGDSEGDWGSVPQLAEIDKTLLIHDAGLRDIYQKLRPLLAPPPEQPKPEIGFHVKEDAARTVSDEKAAGRHERP